MLGHGDRTAGGGSGEEAGTGDSWPFIPLTRMSLPQSGFPPASPRHHFSCPLVIPLDNHLYFFTFTLFMWVMWEGTKNFSRVII